MKRGREENEKKKREGRMKKKKKKKRREREGEKKRDGSMHEMLCLHDFKPNVIKKRVNKICANRVLM